MLGLLICIVGLIVSAGLVLGYALVVAQPNLPSLKALTDYCPKVPLRVYTTDHVLISEFGKERRSVVRIQDVPDYLKKAVLAIEDARFYDHGGVDLTGILRAGTVALTNGHASQGASTITMQVARNFFLSSEKTYYPQDLRNAARLQDRACADERPDPRGLYEPDLSGTAGLWVCERRAGLISARI